MPNSLCPKCGGNGRINGFQAWGDQVRQARKDLGLSLRSFAGDVGCTSGHLSRLERGEATAIKGPLRARINAELGLE